MMPTSTHTFIKGTDYTSVLAIICPFVSTHGYTPPMSINRWMHIGPATVRSMRLRKCVVSESRTPYYFWTLKQGGALSLSPISQSSTTIHQTTDISPHSKHQFNTVFLTLFSLFPIDTLDERQVEEEARSSPQAQKKKNESSLQVNSLRQGSSKRGFLPFASFPFVASPFGSRTPFCLMSLP
jgi:hypothetical protein